MDIREYLAAWQARWKTIVVCVVLVAGAALVASALTQPSYSATTRLFVSTTGGASVGEAYQGNLFSTGRVVSYANLAMGKQVAQRTVDQLGLDESAESVMSRVTAVSVPDSVLLDITVSDSNPYLVRDLANVVASQTSSLVQELETSARGGTPAAAATIVDLADVPAAATSPQPVRNLLFGVIAGLILGLIAAVVRSKLDRSVRSDAAVGAAVGAPLLGSLPRASVPRGKAAVSGPFVFGSDSARFTEACREVRTNVLAMAAGGDMRTLVVAAPRAGTASNIVAAGLSAALAETKRSVVLVDGNLRDGSLGSMFSIDDKPGLGDYLRGEAALDDVVTPTAFDNLSLVVARGSGGASHDLLGSAALAELIPMLHEHFDFVLLDAPAVLDYSDAGVLVGVCDGGLLVGHQGSTTGPDLAESANKLRLAGSRVVGCVSVTQQRRLRSR